MVGVMVGCPWPGDNYGCTLLSYHLREVILGSSGGLDQIKGIGVWIPIPCLRKVSFTYSNYLGDSQFKL